MIEIQRSLVDLVLFSRSSMGDQDLPRQCRVSRGERNSIIPEDRISLGQKQLPRSPSTLSLPSFLLPASRIFADSPPARRTEYLISFIHQPFSRPRDLHAVAAAPAKRMKAGRLPAAQTRQIARPIFLPANAIDIDFLLPLPGC